MKTIKLLLPGILLMLFFSLSSEEAKAQFESSGRIMSENNLNGTIVVEMRQAGRLSFRNNDGNWVEIVKLHHHNSDNYSSNYDDLEVAFVQLTNCWYCWWDMPEFYVAFKPPEGHYNRDIQLRYEDSDNNETNYATAQAWKPEKPNNIRVSQLKYCNEVKISWDPIPDNVYKHGSYPMRYDIFRDSTYIGSTYYGTTTFTDNNTEPGKTYYYDVRYVITDNLPHPYPWDTYITYNSYYDRYDITDAEGSQAPWEYNHGERSYPMVGSSKKRLRAPMEVFTNNSACGNAVELNWYAYEDTANDNTIKHYKLQRSTDKNFSAEVHDTIAHKDSIVVEDFSYKVPKHNTKYYFRVKTVNVCGNASEEWSDAAEGSALTKPAAPENLKAVFNGDGVNLTWDDKANEETNYIIHRSPNDINVSVKADQTEYLDTKFSVCTPYTYTVEAINGCGNSETISADITVQPDTSKLFNPSTFEVSKGYYPDRVELTWENISILVEEYQIYRKEYGADDFKHIGSTSGSATSYSDEAATPGLLEAATPGVLYEYKIKPSLDCDGNMIETSGTVRTGFRVKAGTVSGKVLYEDGSAVKNAEVLLSPTTDSLQDALHEQTKALDFKGNDHVTVPYSISLNLQNAFTLQTWIKPDTLTEQQTLLEKTNGTSAYGITLAGDDVEIWIKQDADTTRAIAKDSLTAGKYMHVAGTFDGSELKIFFNGKPVDSTSFSGSTETLKEPLYIGTNQAKSAYYNGRMDEILVWAKARSNKDIALNYDRILSGREDGLKAYWRVDINKGHQLFDYSKTGETFNKNHGIIHGAAWSDDTPSRFQLDVKGMTNENGRYTITHIRYNSVGNSFKFTPFYGQHTFVPEKEALRTFYLGEGSYYNTMNFTDISSVKVTGSVQYKNSRCMARGIGLYLDGKPVMKNDKHLKTDKNGEFQMNVPSKGEHRISVGKKGHQFDPGVWPGDGPTVFNEPVSGIEFMDTTTIRLVGRVVGGLVEANKKPALGKSKNNLGKAEIVFRSQMGFGCSTDTVTTDTETGEYAIDLLPLNYIIKDVTILNNLAIDFGTQEILNLSNYAPYKTVYDTTISAPDTLVDSASYQVRRDFIYRTDPRIKVTDPNKNPFVGEEALKFEDENGNPAEIPLTPDITGFPVFFAGEDYTARIFIHEQYENADDGMIDRVPLKNATIRVNNDIALIEGETDYTKTLELENEKDGDTLYTFTAGEPNYLINSTYPEYNYTKTFKIETEVNSISADWHPGNSGEGDSYYRGFVLGRKSTKNADFVSGPSSGNVPSLITILRDPPGDQSQAFLEQGSTFSESTSIKAEGGATFGLDISTDFGTDQEIDIFPAGPDVQFSSKAGPTLNLAIGRSADYETTQETSYQINERIATSGAPELVGAREDLFVGSIHNYTFGKTNKLTLVEDSLCQQTGGPVSCMDSTILYNGQTFRIGLKDSYLLIDSIKSMFSLTHDHIKNYLIPNLQKLRNNNFVRSENYTSYVDADDPRYGTNNDAPVWGSQASSGGDGPSYKHNGGGTDSIRWYNAKIKAWEEILEENEREKSMANTNRNITFEGGGSQYDYAYSITEGNAESFSAGFSFEIGAGVQTGFSAMGIGFTLNFTASVSGGATFGNSSSSDTTVAYGYSLADDDQGDYFTVDVAHPHGIDDLSNTNINTLTGPIFTLRGGRSMCPWEGPVTTSYFKPVGQKISTGTMQREKPQLNVTPNVQNNIPADQPAVFKLSLGNASETDETMWYKLKIAENSNPHGANISLDGKGITREFEIPGGETFQKTLTLAKVPGVDNYNNIEIHLYSGCEWDYHTNGGVMQAVDTVTITAQFIPSCSNIAYHAPNNQWVANTSNRDTLWTVIGDYNKNFPNFKKFQIQYKHVSEGQWNALSTYWNDSTGINDTTITMIPKNQSYTMYPWDISQVPDGAYEIRSVSYCPLSKNYTEELRGTIDRIRPHAYGSPQPADGVLSPNDDMYITFNEPLHGGKLTKLNMDISGVLNGAELVHNASVNFDGENDYVDIPAGLAVSGNQSFTFELWIKRNSGGQETVLSQENSSGDPFKLGFNENNRFQVQFGSEKAVTQTAITDQLWHHYACTYNADKKQMVIYLDGEPVTVKTLENITYRSAQKITLGHDGNGAHPFNGNAHELRLWHIARQQEDGIVAKMNRQLSGMEFGLIGYWPLDDAFGTIAKEKVHHRHAKMHATWGVYPSGNSYFFDQPEDFLTMKTGKMVFTESTDFTISFWFKSGNGQNVTFLSNGKGDGTDPNTTGWAIHTNEAGQILVENNSHTFKAADKNYFDNNWHHFSLVVSRHGNTHAFMDGKLQNTISSENWSGFEGPKLWIGSRGWLENSVFTHDEFYQGHMDELRIWYMARKHEQIKRDMTHKLSGKEIGLMAYFPFEKYEEDAGVNVLKPSLSDKSDTSVVPSFSVVPAIDTTFSSITPNVKLQRPVEKVNYNYSFKEDEIMFCIGSADCPGESNISADELKRIENSTLDVTVKDVYDLNANKMLSPATWTVYVDQMPVKWKQDQKNIEKKLYAAKTFEATIENQSGRSQDYTIQNLPEWISVSNDFGTLAPQSSETLTFEIHEGLNIGSYSQQIYVYNKAYDFNEKLLVTVDVSANAPKWEVAEEDYQYSMNIIGQLAIDSIISQDENDVVAAFVDGKCRGVANVEYVASYDLYEVFLDVYSPVKYEEHVKLRVWDASKNQVHEDVTPQLAFNADKVMGTASNPHTIYATNIITRNIHLADGWNWIAFNLASPALQNPDSLFRNLQFNVGNQLKGQDYYDQFDKTRQWKGSITNSGGLRNEAMYMLQTSAADTLTYTGIPVNPEKMPIQLRNGWNWIGYPSNQNLEVNDALSNYHPTEKDIIKSQRAFAMYDDQMGWLGSLDYLAPNKGYMLFVQQDDELLFPEKGLFSVPTEEKEADKGPMAPKIWDIEAADYQNTMNIVAKIQGNAQVLPDESDYIGVFSGNTCVGIAEPHPVEQGNEYLYFITAYSNAPREKLAFRYYDYSTARVHTIADTMQFTMDDVKGTHEKPVILRIGDKHNNPVAPDENTRVYPNPFTEEVTVQCYLKDEADVTIRVMDITGSIKAVKTYSNRKPGWNTLTWNGGSGDALPAGTYLIEIQTPQYNKLHRIIKSAE